MDDVARSGLLLIRVSGRDSRLFLVYFFLLVLTLWVHLRRNPHGTRKRFSIYSQSSSEHSSECQRDMFGRTVRNGVKWNKNIPLILWILCVKNVKTHICVQKCLLNVKMCHFFRKILYDNALSLKSFGCPEIWFHLQLRISPVLPAGSGLF